MLKKTLTARQKEILDFIARHIEEQGFPPTIPEMQKEFSFKSPNAVTDHLEALARKGYITRYPFKSRGIGIIGAKKSSLNINVREIPVVGRIAAGSPLLAEENITDTIYIDSSFVKVSNGRMEGIFALKVKGDSMKDAGIFNGDYVIIQKQAQVNQGEIAAVLIDEEATIKRVYREKDRIRLQPENELFKPIIIDPAEQNVSIIGIVKSVIRSM